MNSIMQSSPQKEQDDPFADLCADIDSNNNQLVSPAEFGTGIAKPEEATEHTASATEEDDSAGAVVEEATKTATTTPAKESSKPSSTSS